MIQEMINHIYYDDIVVIFTEDGMALWEGLAAEYNGQIDEEEYCFDCITAIETTRIGVIVRLINND